MRRPAIVIVTFKRQELLAQLFESIKKLTVPAWRVVVVDNENSPRTAQMAASFAAELDAAWGPTTDDPDAEGGTSRLEYVPVVQAASLRASGVPLSWAPSGSGSWTTTWPWSPTA